MQRSQRFCLSDDLARGPQLAGQPAQGIGLQRVHGNRYFFEAMAGAAFEAPQLKATLTRRNPRQTHPVLASRAHRPLRIGTQDTHPATPAWTIRSCACGGLSDTGLMTKKFHLFRGVECSRRCKKPIAAELLLANVAAGRSGASCPRAGSIAS